MVRAICMELKVHYITWRMDLIISTSASFLHCCLLESCRLQGRSMLQTCCLLSLLSIFGWHLCLCSLTKRKGWTYFFPLYISLHCCSCLVLGILNTAFCQCLAWIPVHVSVAYWKCVIVDSNLPLKVNILPTNQKFCVCVCYASCFLTCSITL